MKKLLFLLAVILSVSGCSVYKQFTGYVTKNCIATKATDAITHKTTITYECANLYNPGVIKDKCSTVQICFDAATAKISGKAVCNDSLVDIQKLIQIATGNK